MARRGRRSQRMRFKRAARMCKGRSRGAFRACMRSHLKR